MRLETQELIIILIVVIIIFGPTQIPKLTKMFGKSVKNFKEGMEEEAGSAPESKKVKTAKSANALTKKSQRYCLLEVVLKNLKVLTNQSKLQTTKNSILL